MTRLARYDIPDIPRRVIQRGNNRCVTFVADEEVRALPLRGATLGAIRDATNKAWPLGSDRFKEGLASQTERRVAPVPRGRPRKEEDRR